MSVCEYWGSCVYVLFCEYKLLIHCKITVPSFVRNHWKELGLIRETFLNAIIYRRSMSCCSGLSWIWVNQELKFIEDLYMVKIAIFEWFSKSWKLSSTAALWNIIYWGCNAWISKGVKNNYLKNCYRKKYDIE